MTSDNHQTVALTIPPVTHVMRNQTGCILHIISLFLYRSSLYIPSLDVLGTLVIMVHFEYYHVATTIGLVAGYKRWK